MNVERKYITEIPKRISEPELVPMTRRGTKFPTADIEEANPINNNAAPNKYLLTKLKGGLGSIPILVALAIRVNRITTPINKTA